MVGGSSVEVALPYDFQWFGEGWFSHLEEYCCQSIWSSSRGSVIGSHQNLQSFIYTTFLLLLVNI